MCFFGSQNADPDVRVDAETFLNKTVPEVASFIECLAACGIMHREVPLFFENHTLSLTVGIWQGRGAPWIHTDEGPDDMPAHIRTALTQTQLTIPVQNGRPVLGTWQGIYLFEHRRYPHRRQVSVHLLGE